MRKMVAGSLCLAFATLGPMALVAQGTNPQPAPAASWMLDGKPIDRTTLHVQVILDHLGFSPGVIDGRPGMSLTAALKGFQEARGLAVTGMVDRATLKALYPYRQLRPTRVLTLTEGALAGPFVNPLPTDAEAQSKLPAMSYRAPIEKLAEMFHTTPEVLVALNPPGTRLVAGAKMTFPNALPTSRAYDPKLPDAWRKTLNDLNVSAVQPQAAKIVVDKSEQVLRVMDANGKLIAQFMATMGSAKDPLPIGNWTIRGISYNPDWKRDPSILKTVSDKEPVLRIPPGPNSPVGVVWIDLSKEHYGIHGTADPHRIGRAESNGCIRLTNWDAARLSLMVKGGTPAVFRP